MLTFYYAVPPSLGLPLLQKLLQPLQCFTIDSRRTSDLHTPAAFFIEHPCRKLQRPRLDVILAPASSNPFAVFLRIHVRFNVSAKSSQFLKSAACTTTTNVAPPNSSLR